MDRTNVQRSGAGHAVAASDAGRLCAGAQLATARELAEIAPGLAAAGYAGLELHPHHLASLGDRVFRARIADAFAAAGMQVACAYVGVPADPPSVSLVRARCDMAAALGAGCVFLVPPSRRGASLEQTAALVREVAVHAGPLGLAVAVHNHAGTAVTTVDEVVRLLELVDRPEAGLCLDVAHLALFEDDVPGAIEALAPLVGYVHFKDLEGWAREALAGLDGDSLEGVAPLTPAYTDLGAGALDLRAAIAALAATGEVWTAIEMETLRGGSVLEQSGRNAEAYRALAAAAAVGAARP